MIRHAYEHHLPDVRACVTGWQELLDEAAENKTAAAVRDRVDQHRLSEPSQTFNEIDSVVMWCL